MSNTRSRAPAHIAGILSLCVAAAVGAQTPAPGTTNTTRPPAATTAPNPSSSASRPATPATDASAMGSNSAKGAMSSDALSRADKKFMEKAAAGGMAEVQLGQLAAQKAATDDVKKFGQRMVDDHSKANDQLKQIASRKGVDLPTQLDRSAEHEMDKLSKLQGAAFDREYMKHMVADHKKDVSEFKSESRKARDGDVKQFASSTLPTLEEHLSLAQSAQKAASGAARTSSTSSTAPKKTGT